MSIFTKEWFQAAGVRALRTFAQVLVGSVAVGAAFSDVDWLRVLSVAGVSGVLSIATSLAGLPEVADADDSH